jgi:hypothetical protein
MHLRSLPISILGFLIFAVPTHAGAVENIDSVESRYNANDAAIGTTLFQGNFGWCFAYSLADVVSQKLGFRVSPPQVALNQFANADGRQRIDWEKTLYGRARLSRALLKQNEIGFCPLSDPFNTELQSWVASFNRTPPDRPIAPVLVKIPIYRSAIKISWGDSLPADFPSWRDEEAWMKTAFESLGSGCKALGVGRITCEKYNALTLSQLQHRKIDILDREKLSSSEFPNDSTASTIGWNEQPVGTFDQIGYSLAHGAYIIQKAERDFVTVAYHPYTKIFASGNYERVGRLAYLSNQCRGKAKIDQPTSILRDVVWPIADRRSNTKVQQDVLDKVDEIIGAGKVLSFVFPISTGEPHAISIVGRICGSTQLMGLVNRLDAFEERDRENVASERHCVYLVRNSAYLDHTLMTAEFIRQFGLEAVWFD